jgi:hypothetical protein
MSAVFHGMTINLCLELLMLLPAISDPSTEQRWEWRRNGPV